MVALNFDDAILDGTACPAAPFKITGQGFQLFIMQRYPGDNRNGLTASPFGFAPHPDDTITGRGRRILSADTPLYRVAAGRTHSPQFTGVDERGI